MEFIVSTVDSLNVWAVLAAALVPFPIGFLWYSMNVGFGKEWAKMVGLKKSQVENPDGMVRTFTVLALTALATAVVLACMMKAIEITGLYESVVFGAIVGVVLRGGAHLIHNGFAQRPFALTLTDLGHDMVSLVAMTVILGLWV